MRDSLHTQSVAGDGARELSRPPSARRTGANVRIVLQRASRIPSGASSAEVLAGYLFEVKAGEAPFLYRISILNCGDSMTEKRKYAILFAATILEARTLAGKCPAAALAQ